MLGGISTVPAISANSATHPIVTARFIDPPPRSL